MMTGNEDEREICERFPELVHLVKNITSEQFFETFDPSLSLSATYTAGHLDDHMSFILNDMNGPTKYLISGDIILGAPSALILDLDIYLKDLKRLQAMDFDWILLPHSVGLETEQIIVEAKQKIADYIEYRESRLQLML
jgi:glyoxylase-like metal-dependent hydrolase (beta-lactamase superfamily II)